MNRGCRRAIAPSSSWTHARKRASTSTQSMTSGRPIGNGRAMPEPVSSDGTLHTVLWARGARRCEAFAIMPRKNYMARSGGLIVWEGSFAEARRGVAADSALLGPQHGRGPARRHDRSASGRRLWNGEIAPPCPPALTPGSSDTTTVGDGQKRKETPRNRGTSPISGPWLGGGLRSPANGGDGSGPVRHRGGAKRGN